MNPYPATDRTMKHLHQISNDDVYATLRERDFSRARTAKELRVNVEALRVRIRKLKDIGYRIPRDPALSGRHATDNDPTPEEIRELCRMFQERWTPIEEQVRRGARETEAAGYQFPRVGDLIYG